VVKVSDVSFRSVAFLSEKKKATQMIEFVDGWMLDNSPASFEEV